MDANFRKLLIVTARLALGDNEPVGRILHVGLPFGRVEDGIATIRVWREDRYLPHMTLDPETTLYSAEVTGEIWSAEFDRLEIEAPDAARAVFLYLREGWHATVKACVRGRHGAVALQSPNGRTTLKFRTWIRDSNGYERDWVYRGQLPRVKHGV